MKQFLTILIGSIAVVVPIYLYTRYFSGLPCPDCKYLGTGIESYLAVALLGGGPVAVIFFITFLISNKKWQSVNLYSLGVSAATFAVLDTTVVARFDEYVAVHFAYQDNHGYFWPLSTLAEFVMAFLVVLIFFRKDFFSKKEDHKTPELNKS